MKTWRIVLVALVALVAGVIASADAQTLLYTLDSPNPQANAWFGFSVGVGDVNGDGKGDIAVGAMRETVDGSGWRGRAYVFSGTDGSVLLTLDSPIPVGWAWFGISVGVGEVDGDGKADIAVGAPLENVGGNDKEGRAYVFSGADGSLLFTLDMPTPQANAVLGSSVGVGEVDGDGKADIAVGAPGENVGGNDFAGRAYVFSGDDGSVLLTLESPNPQEYADFGWSVALGDVNGDGKGDVAVGAYYENVGGNDDQGRAYVFSGTDGSLLLTLDSPNPQGNAEFGYSVAVGDADGDGKEDIAVGAHEENVGDNVNQGRAYVFSGVDGSLLFTLDSPNPQASGHFGSSVAVGEMNGDGRGDIAVGAHGQDQVYVFSGADSALLFTLDSPGSGAFFGHSVAVGEVDGDGRGDVAVGAYWEDVGSNDRQGRAYVFASPPPPAVGGIAELPDVADSSGRNYFAVAGLTAAAVVALSAGGWYVRRRWLS